MKLIARVFLVALIIAGAALGWAWHVIQTPLSVTAEAATLRVKSGDSLKAVFTRMERDGTLKQATVLWWYARLNKRATNLAPGQYKLTPGMTPLELLDKLEHNEVEVAELRIAEGSTFRDVQKLLAGAPNIKPTLADAAPERVLQAIGAAERHPEGLFFPDTYQVDVGSSDLDLLKRSYRTMQQRLQQAWDERDPNIPLKSPYEALILASIIEKETGAANERATVSSVFHNRMRIGMRLQTDPTVIYGMGEAFDGNIRKRDLQTDTPYNTYTRNGLPPTPIAMPSQASITAAVKPATTQYLYFVGKGDGTHYFSKSLEEHNRAVAKYQLGR